LVGRSATPASNNVERADLSIQPFDLYSTFSESRGLPTSVLPSLHDPHADLPRTVLIVLEQYRGVVSRGLEKATSGQPDVFVGYQVALDDRIDYQTINTYYASGWGYRRVYGGVGASQAVMKIMMEFSR